MSHSRIPIGPPAPLWTSSLAPTDAKRVWSAGVIRTFWIAVGNAGTLKTTCKAAVRGALLMATVGES